MGGGCLSVVGRCTACSCAGLWESSKTAPSVHDAYPITYPTVGVQFVCTHCEMGMRYLALRTAAV